MAYLNISNLPMRGWQRSFRKMRKARRVLASYIKFSVDVRRWQYSR